MVEEVRSASQEGLRQVFFGENNKRWKEETQDEVEGKKKKEEAMTPKVREYVKSLSLSGFAIEVGSLDVNGKVSDLFPEYVGLDMRAGPNVTSVANAHDIPYWSNVFDVVLCLEMLEHDTDPFQTIKELRRVLRKGGTLVLTACGISHPLHSYPSDYWRFTTDAFRLLFDGLHVGDVRSDSDHVYGWARK